jgi:hypothetical protein
MMLAAVQKAAEALLIKSAANETARQMLDCVGGANLGLTGLYIHARISNLPLPLVAAMHKNLVEDVAWARTHKDEVEGAQDFAEMQYVLLLAPCAPAAGDHAPVRDATGGAAASLLFDNFDDELLAQEAVSSIFFRPGHSSTPLVAALIPFASISNCVQSITDLVQANS